MGEDDRWGFRGEDIASMADFAVQMVAPSFVHCA